jgi:hypothetical protein
MFDTISWLIGLGTGIALAVLVKAIISIGRGHEYFNDPNICTSCKFFLKPPKPFQ